MMRRNRDPGGSELSLPEVLDASDVRVPVGYRRLAGLTVVENVPHEEAPAILSMLGIDASAELREVGEPYV